MYEGSYSIVHMQMKMNKILIELEFEIYASINYFTGIINIFKLYLKINNSHTCSNQYLKVNFQKCMFL